MSDMVLISPLSKADAQELIQTVRFHLFQADRHENIARQAALKFQKQEGWKSLGYPNLRECFVQELGVSWQHGYRLIVAAEVDQDLSEFSPTGETFTIPETHARQLAKLPAGKRYVAYDRAQTLAAAEGKEPTAKHMEKAVDVVKAEIAVESNPVISHAVAAGEMTPEVGLQIKRKLDSLSPKSQSIIMDLITQYGLTDPELITPLAGMTMRGEGKESKSFEEIARTGHIAGVPLSKSTRSDLKRLNEETQKEHISEGIEKKRQQQILEGLPVSDPVVITLFTNAPEKSATAITRALPLDDLKAVAELLMKHVINEMEKEQVQA